MAKREDQATINYYKNGIEIRMTDGRRIRAMDTPDNHPDGMNFEFVGKPKHGDTEGVSAFQYADDGTPFIQLNLSNESCIMLFLMLAELEDRGFFGIEDFGDVLPNTVDNRNDKNGSAQ